MSLEDIWEDYAADPAFAALRREGVRLCRGRGRTAHPMAMLVGEAPGARENLRGEPFIGPSGILLGRLLGVAGLSWEDVYVTNVVKYWPELRDGSRRPAEDHVVAGVPYLRREYAAVHPDCLVAVGSVAHSVLGAPYLRGSRGRQSSSLTTVAGKHLNINGVDYWPMYHPSHVLRNRKVMERIVTEHWERFGEWIRTGE